MHTTILLLLLFLSPLAGSSIDALLGVSIGMDIEEASAKLNALGTAASRTTREGGVKAAWTLKETDFSSIALKTNGIGKVVWLTGFLRPGKEIPFSKLGDLARASAASDTQVIWNIATSSGGFRLVAKGEHGKAQVIYFLSLTTAQ